jgi:hypothetical protein
MISKYFFSLPPYRMCSLGSQCTMASYKSSTRICAYVPHFSMKTLSLMEVLMPSAGVTTYIMECRGDVDTNVLMNGDPFTQSSDGWTVTSSCALNSKVGRADHRLMPSAFKSHVAGFQYLWMAKERKKHL